MKKKQFFLAQLCFVFALSTGFSQDQPTFVSGDDPKPSGKQWVKVNSLTDEFNSGSLDTNKWDANPEFIYNGSDRGWYGSNRSLFEEDNASVINEELRIENEKFPSPRYSPKDDRSQPAVRKYGGAYVHGTALAKPGYYMEARMRAANSAMSAAFWLKTEPLPCSDLPIGENLELDIQECVGIMTGELGDSWTDDDWAVNAQWDRIFHYNTHRHTQCFNGSQQTVGGKINHGLNRDAFHIYGAYLYPDGKRVDFFHNGEFIKSVTPAIPFLGEFRLIMSSNFYDWIEETTAQEMGFNGEKWERSVRFDWVRTWELKDSGSSTSGEFFLVNRETGKKMRTSPTAVEDTPLELVPASWSGAPTKWTKVNTDNGYFYLKNVETGLYMRPTGDLEDDIVINKPTSWDGSYTQWKEVPSSNGYVYLQNRSTGYYIRPQTEDDYSPIIQKPTDWDGSWTQWQLVSTSGSKSLDLEDEITSFRFYPNPASDVINIEASEEKVITIYSIDGTITKSLKVQAGNVNELSVSELTPGVYLMKYDDSIEKLVIE